MIFKIQTFLICIIFTLSFNVLNAQEKDTPRNGEGISTFLQRHHLGGRANEKKFIELNKNKLGKNNELLLGIKYTLPSKTEIPATDKDESSNDDNNSKILFDNNKTSKIKGTSKRTRSTPNYEPLFGKDLANYKVLSNELKGACFYVVSGHGGPDPGAIGWIGSNEVHEDEYAYDIILRLARNLLTKGAKVRIIIQDKEDGIRNDLYLSNNKSETCMGDEIPLNQVERLQQRCDKINSYNAIDKEKYKRAIFVHVDSRSNGDQVDVFFYYTNGNEKSNRLAKTMEATFSQKYDKHQPGRGFNGTIETRDLYVMKHITPTAVFVEVGNIQNDIDQQRIILSYNRQALANWFCEGFTKDYQHYKEMKTKTLKRKKKK
ncbi:MAG: N-acetylmuramoyl-L-alanine amidase [Parabacteroides sp.]